MSGGLAGEKRVAHHGDQRGKLLSAIYAVRSIDGNHQWQAFGLPYLRSDGLHGPSKPNRRRYGFNYHDNP
jgi:hypothetical protein